MGTSQDKQDAPENGASQPSSSAGQSATTPESATPQRTPGAPPSGQCSKPQRGGWLQSAVVAAVISGVISYCTAEYKVKSDVRIARDARVSEFASRELERATATAALITELVGEIHLEFVTYCQIMPSTDSPEVGESSNARIGDQLTESLHKLHLMRQRQIPVAPINGAIREALTDYNNYLARAYVSIQSAPGDAELRANVLAEGNSKREKLDKAMQAYLEKLRDMVVAP